MGTSTVGGSLTVVNTLGNLTQTGVSDGGRQLLLYYLRLERDDHAGRRNALTGAVTLNTTGASGNASLTNNLRRLWRLRVSAAIWR